ncbi:glycosyltransferase family 2 protein [Kineococcus indalonis]|uniref:glycosyltransferase family 2 protein n=1 Tax=Kineococcus indalonis TaxID=2696566 RepID=UPI0014123FB1|nr:glycosyltransferase family A protein [Kineococcus indalonis]NAZ86416.1 glycosyltransferase [Kineococcus indalonis]
MSGVPGGQDLQDGTRGERTVPQPTADVTVVMPAMNRAHLIGRALESIARQGVAPAEVVVVDDASTDGTADVAEAAGARVIRLEQNGGSGPARNLGVRAATTEWVAFLDSDDEWEPGHLEALLRRAGDHVLVCAPARTPAGRVVGNPWRRELPLDPLTLLAPGDVMCTSGTMVRRWALEEAGLFRPLRRVQDLDLWVRVLELGTGVALAEPSVVYHEHVSQAVNDKDLMRECFDRVVRSCAGRPWLTPRVHDGIYSRLHWDDMRAAQRSGDLRGALRHGAWLAGRPHAWPPLAKLLQQRRLSRAR